jgi:hypothetical protein
LGPRSLIALTKRKEKRNHISRSNAKTILEDYIQFYLIDLIIIYLALVNKSGRSFDPKCNPIPI